MSVFTLGTNQIYFFGLVETQGLFVARRAVGMLFNIKNLVPALQINTCQGFARLALIMIGFHGDIYYAVYHAGFSAGARHVAKGLS